MKTWAIVVAAGAGTRFGAPKQFESIGTQRMVDRAVDIARRHCVGVIVVLPAGTAWDGPSVDAAVVGGATRSASVRAGLDAVPEAADVIVVHDAARPLATDEIFGAVIDAVLAGADGAVPGLPVSDTIKRVSGAAVRRDRAPRRPRRGADTSGISRGRAPTQHTRAARRAPTTRR